MGTRKGAAEKELWGVDLLGWCGGNPKKCAVRNESQAIGRDVGYGRRRLVEF